jgi:hypothetical protein
MLYLAIVARALSSMDVAKHFLQRRMPEYGLE